MKKLFIVLAASTTMFVACKKDYSCTCTYNGTTLGTTTIHDTKYKATSACTALNSTYAAYGTGVSCAIK